MDTSTGHGLTWESGLDSLWLEIFSSEDQEWKTGLKEKITTSCLTSYLLKENWSWSEADCLCVNKILRLSLFQAQRPNESTWLERKVINSAKSPVISREILDFHDIIKATWQPAKPGGVNWCENCLGNRCPWWLIGDSALFLFQHWLLKLNYVWIICILLH